MRAHPRLVMSQRTCTTNSDSYQFLVGLFAGAAEGFRQGFKQVGCDERMFTDCFTSHIPCLAVKMHCDENSIQNSLRILCDKTCNHSRQIVPGSAGCHSRIACRIDPNRVIRLSNERAMAFEDEQQLMLPREGASDVQAVVLQCRACRSDQTRHFVGLRSENKRTFAAVQFCRVVCVGVEDIGLQDAWSV